MYQVLKMIVQENQLIGKNKIITSQDGYTKSENDANIIIISKE